MDGLRIIAGWSAVALLAACKPQPEPVAKAIPQAAASSRVTAEQPADLAVPSTAELDAGIADAAPPLAFEKLAGYLQATAACDLGPVDVDPYCPAYRRYATARQRLQVRAGLVADYAALGLRFLGDQSPVVRMLAAQLTTAQLHKTYPQLLAAAEREKHPQVQVVLLTLLAQPAAAAGQGALLDLAEKLVPSATLAVRVAALQLLVQGPQRYLNTLQDRLLHGELPEQVVVCRGVARQQPQAVGELLGRAELNKELRAACSQGLVDAICQGQDATAAKTAWSLVKAELAAATATAKRPAWQAVEALHCAADVTATAQDRPELLAQLRELVDAETASGFARAAAVKSLGKLGAPRGWMSDLAKRYETQAFGAAGQVRRALLDEGWLAK